MGKIAEIWKAARYMSVEHRECVDQQDGINALRQAANAITYEEAEMLDQHLEANRELYELRRFAQHVREYAIKSSPDYPGIEEVNHWEAFYAITCALEGTESANRSWHKLATCLREAFKMTPEEFVEAFAETDQIDPETLVRLRKQLGIKEDA